MYVCGRAYVYVSAAAAAGGSLKQHNPSGTREINYYGWSSVGSGN